MIITNITLVFAIAAPSVLGVSPSVIATGCSVMNVLGLGTLLRVVWWQTRRVLQIALGAARSLDVVGGCTSCCYLLSGVALLKTSINFSIVCARATVFIVRLELVDCTLATYLVLQLVFHLPLRLLVSCNVLGTACMCQRYGNVLLLAAKISSTNNIVLLVPPQLP